jgi:aspartyl-tRNA(Asn)/glutamyl-tRNA(Gln) amidotransferase subunit A
MSDDPVTRPVAELSAGLRSGKLTSVALVESALGRIAALDPRLESFVCLADNARAQAAATDAEIGSGRWRGPLHGVPAAVKDNYYLTVDMPTRAGTDAPGITLDYFLTLWPTARTC